MGRGNPLQSAAVDAIGRVLDKPKLTLEEQVKTTLQKQHGLPDFDPSPTSYQRKLPLDQQADILLADINTQTKLNGSNTRIEPELVDIRPNARRFDDVESAKRFLVFFIYLDDNERGETNFPQLGLASPCRQGSMLMFPPLWTHKHIGHKPIEKPKYIIGSYLHYI